MILKFLVLFLLTIFSKSDFSENRVFPFSSTIDLGTPIDVLILSLQAEGRTYQIDSFSCDRIAVTTFKKDLPNDSVEVVYYFRSIPFITNRQVVSGLYQVELNYSNDMSRTSDDKIVDVFVTEFADLMEVKIKKRKNIIIENEILNDRQHPKNGVFNLDGVWFVANKEGNVVSFNFPKREFIKRGQKSRIVFKQMFSIDWKCE